jgi:peptide-methionine (S)-S-oxide reductase
MSWFSDPAMALDIEKFPAPAVDAEGESGKRKVVLAGGCFWCTEAVFEQIDGVKKVVSGYAGGTAKTANYKAVSMGASDHAEVIEVTYDSAKVSLGHVLKVFFSVAHDPTQVDRQGPDHGRQYRSGIFYADDAQKKVAEAYIAQLNAAGVFKKPIATEVSKLDKFYPAEDYHQDFVKRNPNQPYVVVNAIPKVKKTKKHY